MKMKSETMPIAIQQHITTTNPTMDLRVRRAAARRRNVRVDGLAHIAADTVRRKIQAFGFCVRNS